MNCLLALAWPNHQFHAPVVARLERRPLTRWATCALTQLGFVRLSSDPTIVGLRQTPAEVLALLGELARDARHMYLASLPPLPRVASHFRRLLGHQQVTDAYLVAIAESHEATLLTLDRRIVLPGASRHPVEVVVP